MTIINRLPDRMADLGGADMTDEPTHIATAAASLDDPYAALSQHLHGDGDTSWRTRALAAEADNARLRAERDAAWQAGAEAMRKEAARAAVVTPASRSDKAGLVWHDGFTSGCLHAADAIRAMPLTDQPKVD